MHRSGGITVSVSTRVREPTADDVRFHERLKHATVLKREHKLSEAATELEQAIREAISSGVAVSLETKIRYAQYLYNAGQKDQAWSEFNRLIQEVTSSGVDRTVLPMDLSILYDKMAGILEKEKRWNEFALTTLLSRHFWLQGLSFQERLDELRERTTPEATREAVQYALERTGSREKVEEALALVSAAQDNIGQTTAASLRRSLAPLLN